MESYNIKNIFIGKLTRGTDLYSGITDFIQSKNVRTGRVTGMGAVQRAKLAYYDQQAMKYCDLIFNHAMEIVSLYGNISVRDGVPFAHVHVVLSDAEGKCIGGHLLPGNTPVFACELIVEEFGGRDLVRQPDSDTGLALWPGDAALVRL